MAKWEVGGDGPRNGEVRAINYVDGVTVPEDAFGNTGHPIPLIRHRFEQFWDGTWAPINVYHDSGDGNLQRIKDGNLQRIKQ